MKRSIWLTIAAILVALGLSAPAMAGSPHFVGKTDISVDGNVLTVSGKIAGLGNEAQVHVEVSADAECINPGGNKPAADNKETFAAGDDFPVQNGKANFTLVLTATFQPDCTPPMTLEWSNIVVVDTTHGISQGPFSL